MRNFFHHYKTAKKSCAEACRALENAAKRYQISDKFVGKVNEGSPTNAIASTARYNRLKLVDMLLSAGGMANSQNH